MRNVGHTTCNVSHNKFNVCQGPMGVLRCPPHNIHEKTLVSRNYSLLLSYQPSLYWSIVWTKIDIRFCISTLISMACLRIERDDFGPQVEVEYWKSRAAKLTLLVEQITSMPCKMTLVTLRAGKCKLLKVGYNSSRILQQERFQGCLIVNVLPKYLFC